LKELLAPFCFSSKEFQRVQEAIGPPKENLKKIGKTIGELLYSKNVSRSYQIYLKGGGASWLQM
jgi:hypothetical protein